MHVPLCMQYHLMQEIILQYFSDVAKYTVRSYRRCSFSMLLFSERWEKLHADVLEF